MAVDKLVDSGKLDACCAAEAAAIIAKGGGTAPLAYDFANNKGFADAIASIPSGGTEITDGIVVKARDANGYATEIKVYSHSGEIKPYGIGGLIYSAGGWQFQNVNSIEFADDIHIVGSAAFAYLGKLATISLPNAHTIGSVAFYQAGITSLELPSLTDLTIQGGEATSPFKYMGKLKTLILPKIQTTGGARWGSAFTGCNALESVTIGSVGNGLAGGGNESIFYGITKSGLTITGYTTGAVADSLLAAWRNGATNATIIIKASENTTYNGTAYAAGETMITSNP